MPIEQRLDRPALRGERVRDGREHVGAHPILLRLIRRFPLHRTNIHDLGENSNRLA
jgi:hypothetical protein